MECNDSWTWQDSVDTILCAHFVILLSILTLCRSLKVELIGVQGRNYGLVVTDLCGKIVADQSFVKVHVF